VAGQFFVVGCANSWEAQGREISRLSSQPRRGRPGAWAASHGDGVPLVPVIRNSERRRSNELRRTPSPPGGGTSPPSVACRPVVMTSSPTWRRRTRWHHAWGVGSTRPRTDSAPVLPEPARKGPPASPRPAGGPPRPTRYAYERGVLSANPPRTRAGTTWCTSMTGMPLTAAGTSAKGGGRASGLTTRPKGWAVSPSIEDLRGTSFRRAVRVPKPLASDPVAPADVRAARVDGSGSVGASLPRRPARRDWMASVERAEESGRFDLST